MSKPNRMRMKKRALPDWIVDDEADNTKVSAGAKSLNKESGGETTDELDSIATGEKQNHQTENNVPRAKKPFSRPKYEYLPGNKHGQQSQTCIARNPEVKEQAPVLTADDVVAQAMPFISFGGSVVYSYNVNDCAILCEEIWETYLTGEKVGTVNVGFDLEWPVTYEKGEGGGKVALVQLSMDENKCFLFHISAMGSFPKSLKKFIEEDKVMKIGVNIEMDMWKLAKDFDFDARRAIKNSVLDLGKFANAKMKSKENWSLDGLCRNVLHLRMDKDSNIRCGKWDDYPLSDQQKLYAATDAYACLKIYNTLSAVE